MVITLTNDKYIPEIPHEVVWICSNGGPLLMLPSELLYQWEGIQPPTANRHIQARSRWAARDAPPTDYDRACEVDDYLGWLSVGSGLGIVLDREAMETCWLPAKDDPSGMLVRWEYADYETSEFDWLTAVPDEIWKPEGRHLDVTSEQYMVFDSAYPGQDVDRYLEVYLQRGRYTVTTALFKPDAYTSFVLHKFLKI